MYNYSVTPPTPQPAGAASLPPQIVTRNAHRVVLALLQARVGTDASDYTLVNNALTHLFNFAPERDFNHAFDELLFASQTLREGTPHLDTMNNFIGAGAPRRIQTLHQSTQGHVPVKQRGQNLEVATILAETAPDPYVRMQGCAIAATLRQMLMPDSICITKGTLPGTSHDGFAAAFKNTYVAPTLRGNVKLLREVVVMPDNVKYLMEKTVAHGAFGSIHLTTTPDGQEGAVKVTHYDRDGSKTQCMDLEKIKRANDLMIRAGSPLAATLAVVEGKVHAFGNRYSGDAFDVTGAIAYDHPLRPAIMAKTFRDLCRDIDRAHKAFIVHRDIKPENILYHPGRPMALCDYDLAYDAKEAVEAGGDMSCPMHDVNPGTPIYQAPEMVINYGQETYDEKVDMWSAGVTFFYMNSFDWRNVPFQQAQTESEMLAAYNEMHDWRMKRSPTNSAQGPLDWDAIKAGSDRLDLAAKMFHQILGPVAEYVVESLLDLDPAGRPDGSDMAVKAEELYAPYAHLEPQIDQTLQEIADTHHKARATAYALQDHANVQMAVQQEIAANPLAALSYPHGNLWTPKPII